MSRREKKLARLIEEFESGASLLQVANSPDTSVWLSGFEGLEILYELWSQRRILPPKVNPNSPERPSDET